MTALSIVGDWLLAGSKFGPLTSTERMTFLEKIASFDLNGLSDIALQPVADLVADIVMEMYNQFSIVEFGEDEDLPLARALVACSINANPQIRALILDLYCIDSGGKGSRSFQGYSPIELLWQLVHSDFNGLGSRMWTMLFVEVLLAGCRLRSVEADSGHNKEAWLPRPCKKSLAACGVAGLADGTATLNTAIRCGGEVRLSAVITLAHSDFALCQSLLNSLLSAAWAILPSDKYRLALVPALETLLSQPCYSQFIRVPRVINLHGCAAEQNVRGINAIRSFLNATLKFRPLPAVDGSILEMAAEKYNCWHEVLTLLEHQYRVLSGSSLSKRGEQLRNATVAAIRRGYCQLEESNIGLALAAKSCTLPETEYAVSLDVYDMVKDALSAYSALVELAETADQTRTVEPTDFEMDLWEERWVALEGEMCQLPVVYDYASSTDDPRLLLDCAWKTQDWDKVRVLCSSSALLPAIEDGDPSVKMGEILLAINEGKLSDVESLHVQTAQLCLQKWQLLPGISTGSIIHASLLHIFHRLVELRESGQIMVETSSHSKRRTLPDLKNLLR
jgi:transformation/transcription domain-associated protein